MNEAEYCLKCRGSYFLLPTFRFRFVRALSSFSGSVKCVACHFTQLQLHVFSRIAALMLRRAMHLMCAGIIAAADIGHSLQTHFERNSTPDIISVDHNYPTMHTHFSLITRRMQSGFRFSDCTDSCHQTKVKTSRLDGVGWLFIDWMHDLWNGLELARDERALTDRRSQGQKQTNQRQTEAKKCTHKNGDKVMDRFPLIPPARRIRSSTVLHCFEPRIFEHGITSIFYGYV